MMCFNVMHVGRGSKASEAETYFTLGSALGFLLVMDNISIKMFSCIQMRECRVIHGVFPAQHHSVSLLKLWGNKRVTSINPPSPPRYEHVFNCVFFPPTTCFGDLLSPGMKLIFHGHETRAVEKYQRAYLNPRAKKMRKSPALWAKCEHEYVPNGLQVTPLLRSRNVFSCVVEIYWQRLLSKLADHCPWCSFS